MRRKALVSKIKSRIKSFILGIRKDILDSYVRQYPSREQPYRLHIGCGGVLKPDWVNIDIKKPADLVLDIRNGLPFPDSSCEIVYSEHFFEHLDWPSESNPFLKECYRVLRNEGVIHIGVPDSSYVVEQCLYNLESFVQQAHENNWGYPADCQTAFEFINYHFRLEGSHKFAYDFKTLALHLEQAGFRGVKRREYDVCFDSKTRATGTLYVIAMK